ncbi:hypothetical protein P153DRAFT_389389 [Dothidotthia symphoricarpi CBS 119687]|uniref:Uncharacterized protein n=1 Tax=Dothidotthia symphoricarpi CBS 119687 TaxID=1392245 RepID=A0A6A6A326_9PLEO|nr:uncharacterized protein P153DRAFT_389389 [Dothidotthia symphoricarpi CBS 119687]KAF2125946.1 hypothetical protein P153DRAFT_389389 [Dothidotthia symphoricarpi CBS 119687]
MAYVYMNAYMTISATSAIDGDGGFLIPRRAPSFSVSLLYMSSVSGISDGSWTDHNQTTVAREKSSAARYHLLEVKSHFNVPTRRVLPSNRIISGFLNQRHYHAVCGLYAPITILSDAHIAKIGKFAMQVIAPLRHVSRLTSRPGNLVKMASTKTSRKAYPLLNTYG